MLHLIKKHFARAQQPIRRTSPNAEYADLRQRLSSIKFSLKYTSDMLSTANRIWVKQMQQQRQFSERFYESYPTTTDETYIVAQDFAEGSQALYDKFTRDTTEDILVAQQIHDQVLLYIGEIEQVESLYGKLQGARSEADRYQAKLDALERSKRPIDPAKKQRNLQKMDTEKNAYKAILKETVAAQKAVYAKHPIIFKAALTSYWLSHEKHVTLLVQSLEKTQEFARKSEVEMRNLDITKLNFDQVSEVSATTTSTPVVTPPRSPYVQSNEGEVTNSKSPAQHPEERRNLRVPVPTTDKSFGISKGLTTSPTSAASPLAASSSQFNEEPQFHDASPQLV